MVKVLGRFEEVNVGDKLRVLDTSRISGGQALTVGRTYTVTRVDSDDDFRITTDLDGDTMWILKSERQYLSTEAYDISELEAKVETLTAQLSEVLSLVRELRAERKTAKAAPKFSPVVERAQTANERRKEAIDRAKADVKQQINGLTFTTVKFEVNAEKRTVVAMAVNSRGKVYHRAMAKAAPGDVFNEHIGKAIAVRRLRSNAVPRFLTHAPQPEKGVHGQVIKAGMHPFELRELVDSRRGSNAKKTNFPMTHIGSTNGTHHNTVVVDDSHADY